MPQKQFGSAKTCNHSNIEQLSMCAVTLRHKDGIARYRFFVVPGDDPMLLGMPGIELLNKLKVICEVGGDQQADRKFDFQTVQPSNSPSCKADT